MHVQCLIHFDGLWRFDACPFKGPNSIRFPWVKRMMCFELGLERSWSVWKIRGRPADSIVIFPMGIGVWDIWVVILPHFQTHRVFFAIPVWTDMLILYSHYFADPSATTSCCTHQAPWFKEGSTAAWSRWTLHLSRLWYSLNIGHIINPITSITLNVPKGPPCWVATSPTTLDARWIQHAKVWNLVATPPWTTMIHPWPSEWWSDGTQKSIAGLLKQAFFFFVAFQALCHQRRRQRRPPAMDNGPLMADTGPFLMEEDFPDPTQLHKDWAPTG